jgi:signal recognition particle subunit SEC65
MDITLSIFLFIIVFSFLCWLTTPVNVNSELGIRSASCRPCYAAELKNFLQENKGDIPFTPKEKISLIDAVELTSVNEPQTFTIQQPIEQQFKEVLQEIDQEVEEDSGESAVGSQKEEFSDSQITTHDSSQSPSKPVTIVKATPVEETDSTSTPDIDLTKINIKQARQIAKTLGITQTVKGKAKPKALLVRQIQQKLNQQNIKTISQLLTAIDRKLRLFFLKN